MLENFFHLISQIYTTETLSEWHCRLHLIIDILQQHSSACCLREVGLLIYAICGRLMYGYQTTRL